MLQGIPTTFVCDHCEERHDRALLCWTVLRVSQVACVRCCGCLDHATLALEDPGGVAVFAGTPLTWRGLHLPEEILPPGPH